MAPKLDHHLHDPQDAETALADDFPSPEPSHPSLDMSSELANQAAAQAIQAAVAASQDEASGSHEPELLLDDVPSSSSISRPPPPPPVQPHNAPAPPTEHVPLFRTPGPSASTSYRPNAGLSNTEQLAILRESYARNPNPSRREYELLAEKTGRDWNKIREYFRQRRNKLRGLNDLEGMEEPGRATGWLQVTYRAASAGTSVSQLNLYHAYKSRFDPYATYTPLLGGQELIQLACATFPGCEMAKDDDEYVLKGMTARETKAEAQSNGVQTGPEDSLVEPLRAGSWLLGTFSHSGEGEGEGESSSGITQTDLYASYAARFSALLPQDDDAVSDAELRDFEHDMSADNAVLDDNDLSSISMAFADPPAPPAPVQRKEDRLLTPVELITLARMAFPKCEPAVDESGRFIIRGLERREGAERGRDIKPDDMFPFALANAPNPSDPTHPFTSLLKRKLAALHPDPDEHAAKRKREMAESLTEEDKELVDGLKRFKDSALGREVRNVCVQQ